MEEDHKAQSQEEVDFLGPAGDAVVRLVRKFLEEPQALQESVPASLGPAVEVLTGLVRRAVESYWQSTLPFYEAASLFEASAELVRGIPVLLARTALPLRGATKWLGPHYRLVEQWSEQLDRLRQELVRQDPLKLLPGQKDLVREVPLRRWTFRKPRVSDLRRAGWKFHRLPEPCRRYLTLLGITGQLAKVETQSPGYYDRLRGRQSFTQFVLSQPVGLFLRLVEEQEESHGDPLTDLVRVLGTIASEAQQVPKQLLLEATVFSMLGFEPRECPQGHRWLAPPTSRARVGCPLHANAISCRRWRSSQGAPKGQPPRGARRGKGKRPGPTGRTPKRRSP